MDHAPERQASSLVSERMAPAERVFLLQVVQPALIGLVDGSVSTLAPLFATAIATGNPHTAFIVGVASALGAGISMGFAEGLSDTGELTGRGHPVQRGAITGIATFIGGVLHTLPFLIPHYVLALTLASVVVAVELVVIALIRHRFMGVPLLRSFLHVTVGGGLVVASAFLLGHA